MNVFVSYTRTKDEFNLVSNLAKHLRNELQQLAPGASVFQDTAFIAPGEQFKERLRQELDSSDALLILLSPAWLTSEYCRWEYYYFKETANRRAHSPLILPLLWVRTPQLERPADDQLAKELAEIEHDDWREIRHETWGNSAELSRRTAKLAETIANGVHLHLENTEPSRDPIRHRTPIKASSVERASERSGAPPYETIFLVLHGYMFSDAKLNLQLQNAGNAFNILSLESNTPTCHIVQWHPRSLAPNQLLHVPTQFSSGDRIACTYEMLIRDRAGLERLFTIRIDTTVNPVDYDFIEVSKPRA